MSFYERRLQADIDEIRAEIVDIGVTVEQLVARSVKALLSGDDVDAYEVVLDDLPVNRRVRALDKRCHAFVARHLPSAGPLRFVSSVLRLNIALERIGDYGVSIARQATVLDADLPREAARLIAAMDEQARLMLRQAVRAWAEQNTELALGTKAMAGTVDSGLHDAYTLLVELGEAEDGSPVRELFGLLTVYARLERVSDQAKNICEEAVFAATGETKPPKRYKVLFVDQTNTSWSQIAERMARKAYPGSGAYSSAGWAPGAALHRDLATLADDLGLDLEGAVPKGVEALDRELEDFHVIVSVDEDRGLPEIPFYTAYLHWSLPENREAAVQELSVRIAGLMERLRGEDAP